MDISLQQTQAQLAKAIAKAEQIGIPMNVAILDIAGYLKGFVRMDNAFPGSIDIAIKKARTSMLFRMNSEEVGNFLKPEVGAFGMENSNRGLMGFAGGLPIKKNDQILGYIGVSGGPIDKDFAVASSAAVID